MYIRIAQFYIALDVKRVLHLVAEFGPRDPLYCKSPCSDRVHSSSTAQFGGRDWSPLSLSQIFRSCFRMHIYIFRGRRYARQYMRYLQDGGRTTGPIQNKQLTHDTLSLIQPPYLLPISLRLAPRAHTPSDPTLSHLLRLSLSW